MVTCPKCAAIVFVDMEGMAHVASETPVATNDSGVGEIVVPLEEPLVPMEFLPLGEMDASIDATEEAREVPTEDPSSVGDMGAFLGYGAESGEPTEAIPSQNDPNDPLGLSAYANSEMSSALNGPLVVTLIISGIDAKDLRDEIRQALQDSRFGWDAVELLSKMTGGVLRIERISPVKATVIINRIKNLSVRIRWEQNAITEIDPIEKDP